MRLLKPMRLFKRTCTRQCRTDTNQGLNNSASDSILEPNTNSVTGEIVSMTLNYSKRAENYVFEVVSLTLIKVIGGTAIKYGANLFHSTTID